MSVFLRIWLFAITVLLIAEDFQYVLKIRPAVVERIASDMENDMKKEGIPAEDCHDDEDEGEAQEEKSEDEKKVKDENKNADPDNLENTFSRLVKTKFRDALSSHASFAHEMESPPPEV